MGCSCHSKCYEILNGLSGMHMPSFSTWGGHLANLQRVMWQEMHVIFQKIWFQKGSRAVEKGYTGFGWIWGDFSNAPKIGFLRRKVTFGHVGICSTKSEKSQKICYVGYFLHVKARWPLTGPRAERRAAAPSIPVGRHLDCSRQCAALEKNAHVAKNYNWKSSSGCSWVLVNRHGCFDRWRRSQLRYALEIITMFGTSAYPS